MKKYNKNVVKAALNMSIPAIVESFFVAFAGLVDSFMVSSCGSEAVAAVGLTAQPKFIGLSLFFAVNVAVSALMARRYGQNMREDANKLLCTTVVFVIFASVIIGSGLVFFAPKIMTMCGSTPETHDNAVTYYRIIMGGMIFNCVQMCINAAQRGVGNTKITMRTNITSNVVNIIMNYFLINGHLFFPKMGIAGAALATVVGTVVSCVMSIVSILKKDNFISIPYIIETRIKPSLLAFKNLVSVGYSVFFEQLLMRVGFVLTAVMAAHQGNAAMAAHQVGMNILGLSFAFGDGVQAAAVALIGRSLGEGKPEKAKEYGSTCQMIGGVISITLAIVYFFSARWLMEMFFKEPEIVDIGVTIMRIMIVTVIFQVRQVIYMGCLRGAGDTFYTAVASTICVTIIRTAVSYIFGYTLGMGIAGIWFGIVGDQLGRFLFAAPRFKMGKWTKIKI